jgi:DNA-binding NarL/FixJ family response regulator
MARIRILVADDHEVVRQGLVLVLRQEPDFAVVAEAGDGLEALMKARDTQPDLALLDWKMPRMSGLEAARAISRAVPTARVLILSGAPVEDAALDALDDGVTGFVHKDVSPTGLAEAIRTVAAGRAYFSAEIVAALGKRSQAPAAGQESPALSPREVEVLQLMATAATYREIGERLFIGEETVRTYAKRILAKLGQPNRTQAVLAAARAGIISIRL